MKQEGKEKLSAFWNKATDFGKKVAGEVQKSAKSFSEQAQKNRYDSRIKKYNPIFKEDFESENFNIPNIIEIVDDAVRRDIDVCEGAIGWIDTVNDVEIFHLYDEFVEKSGLQFIPVWKCDNIYYVDNFNRDRFIDVNSLFGKTNEEKLAELENIAYCLGAKCCSIEIVEADAETTHQGVKIGVASAGNSNVQTSSQNRKKQSGKTVTIFEGNNVPTPPILKWFQHDDNIKRLIEMRCSANNSIKAKSLELKGSYTMTMSRKVACAIDKILKVKGSMSMESQAIKEHSNTLIFELEF